MGWVSGLLHRAGGQVPHVYLTQDVRDPGDEIRGLAREREPTTVRCHRRRIRIAVATGAAIGLYAHQGGRPGQEVPHENVHGPVGVICHQVAGRAGERHVSTVRTDERTGRCSVARSIA